jgi:hypothetical protein
VLHSALSAVRLGATQALGAVAARVVLVTPADTVAWLEQVTRRAERLDDSYSLVSQRHVVARPVVQVCAADARRRHPNEHLVARELVGHRGGGLLGRAVLAAREHGK